MKINRLFLASALPLTLVFEVKDPLDLKHR